jgi:hypothetical protein
MIRLKDWILKESDNDDWFDEVFICSGNPKWSFLKNECSIKIFTREIFTNDIASPFMVSEIVIRYQKPGQGEHEQIQLTVNHRVTDFTSALDNLLEKYYLKLALEHLGND